MMITSQFYEAYNKGEIGPLAFSRQFHPARGQSEINH
jgi:hypothetical protein